ncbi:hypothetical protein LCGC14_0348010 [marine sediment metagenome]|uniref:Uncharacterized protein n=1 Tax=marine sediment metagenome TaxID=412755 RepID=A0A0F9THL3_9ZZZZ
MSEESETEDENSVESVVLRFAGFIAGLFIFLHFLQRMETNQLFLFLAFIGLGLGLHVGFTAWQGFGAVRKKRDEAKERYK